MLDYTAAITWLRPPWTDGIGPVPIQPFGVLVAIGVLFGAWICRRRGTQLGVEENDVRLLSGYLLIAGFFGAHFFDALFYQWDKVVDNPIFLFKVWAGISSYGGFVGAAVGFWLFLRAYQKRMRIKQPSYRVDAMQFADISMWGLLPGFTFGRMGCSIVHDHIGIETSDFALAVDYTAPHLAGIARSAGIEPAIRHNLGFYELLFLLGLLIVAVVVTQAGRKRPVGFIVGLVCVTYGTVRFCLDFLRIERTDPRGLGLTFAQYTSIATVFIGLVTFYLIYVVRPKRAAQSESAEASDGAATEEDDAASRKARNRRKAKSKKSA